MTGGFPDLADPVKAPPTPTEARKITTDEEAEKERAMPRGVYERKKKNAGEAAPPVAGKKRKYTRKQNGAVDVKALATAQLITAARHLHAAVVEHVEIGDNEPLQFALDNFANAKAIYEAL